MRVIATAGHIDHGKSTLVKALTGIDPDRWAEEKARGMTIDLGFASTTLPSGQEIAFVDVPGHVRLIKNMLAGVGSVDGCLFVVAATEGWKPQSEEHLRILELVGIRDGVVALTKVASVDEELRTLRLSQLQERLDGTFLASSRVVEVDVHAGIGLDELRAGLGDLASSLPPTVDSGRPRLWVDRSFSVRGSGTVVTGTLSAGGLAVGDEVVIEPGHLPARIRALQSHHAELREARPTRRLAVNLSGVTRDSVHRGQVLIRPGQWHLTTSFDATLSVLPSIEHPVSRRGAYVVYIGSGEFPAQVRLLGTDELQPGETAPARFWLQATGGPCGLALGPGDRYVLREMGRFETVGGGEILDVDPVVPASRARPTRSMARVVSEHGWIAADHLFRITGERIEPSIGHWVVDPELLASARAALISRCVEAGPAGLDLASLDERERAMLDEGISALEVRRSRVVASGIAPDAMSDSAARVLAHLERGGWSPEPVPKSDWPALRELERLGLAVESEHTWFAASAVQSALGVLSELLQRTPEGFTVSQARDSLSSSRKYVLPLLSYLDSVGAVRRSGDLRTAGPRLVGGT